MQSNPQQAAMGLHRLKHSFDHFIWIQHVITQMSNRDELFSHLKESMAPQDPLEIWVVLSAWLKRC